MPEPGSDMAPGRRWWYVPRELVAVIALQLTGAGAGVAAALAAGGAGPARAAGGAVAGVAGPQQAGMRWLVLAGAVALVLAVPVAAWWLTGDRYSSLSPGAEYLIRPFPVSPAAERAAGRGAVLAAIVAAAWLTWASLRHGLSIRAAGRRAPTPVRPHLCAEPPTKAAAFHSLTWANSGWRASLARLWNHRERAWWRRVQASQWMTRCRGRGRVVRAASSRLISGMVSGIMPGSAGGGWSGRAGGGAWVSVRSLRWAAVMAQMARAAMTSTAWRAIAV